MSQTKLARAARVLLGTPKAIVENRFQRQMTTHATDPTVSWLIINQRPRSRRLMPVFVLQFFVQKSEHLA
jgi:hypothetical protein